MPLRIGVQVNEGASTSALMNPAQVVESCLFSAIRMPFFSVVIPVFNRESLLATSVQSVLDQTFTDYELIIVDDGSTDGSREVASRVSPSAVVVSIANSGPAVARNIGMQRATGVYIAFLDSDDIWYPHTLSIFRSVIEQAGEVSFIAGRLVNIRENPCLSNIKREDERLNFQRYESLSRSPINILTDFGLTSVVVRRDVICASGMFSPWRTNYEDMDMWLRLSDKPGFVYIETPPLVTRILHDDNLSDDVPKCRDGLRNILLSWRSDAYPRRMTENVSHLVECGLRNLLGRIPPSEWWPLFAMGIGCFVRPSRWLGGFKLSIKGMLAVLWCR